MSSFDIISRNYKFENEFEKSVVEKFFKIRKIDKEYVYFSFFSKQELRKIKLLILKQDEFSEILKKIIDNLEIVEDPLIQDMEEILVNELTQSINKSILDRIRKLAIK